MPVEPALIRERGAGEKRDPDERDSVLDRGARRQRFGRARSSQARHGRLKVREDMPTSHPAESVRYTGGRHRAATIDLRHS